MPRIDPLQLLNCLQILLNKDGGILSRDEVQRLVNLMTKFSKKLVSKVIYTLILKSTEPSLISLFMAEGGWRLIHLWLQEAMNTNNMSLTKEVLELLLIAPVDVGLLRSNYGIPKLVKTLTKKDDPEIQRLSKTLVEDWLRLIKGNGVTDQQSAQAQEMSQTAQEVANAVPQRGKLTDSSAAPMMDNNNSEVINEAESQENGGSVYKLSVRDGKQVISRFPQTADEVDSEEAVAEVKAGEEEKEVIKQTEEKKKEKSSSDRSKHKSSRSSSSSSSSKSSSKDKHRDKERSSSSSSKSKKSSSSSSSNSSSSKDKDRKDRKDRDKDKHKSNGSLKSSSSSSSGKSKDKDKKESKEKQAEKDKDTLSKVLPQTPQKLARIPKKPSDEKIKETADKPKEVKKDKNFSIEPRKPGEERPRTVKVFNAKMRSTGLEEEVKPPPPRTGKKPTPSVTLPSIPQKRPSPIKDIFIPPEKKPKIDPPERPGAIKLIPPKPKPAVLQESDIFMDALTASATAKKEPKKRKRRASVSKDSTPASPPQSPAVNQNSNSPNSLKHMAPPKFYQDTLEEKSDDVKDDSDENQGGSTPTDNSEPMDQSNSVSGSTVNRTNSSGLKSVLVHGKRSGPKKSIRWKPDENLVDVQYFELDETERVNVTKNFVDMAKMDMTSEREALLKSRKLPNEDLMDVQTVWRIPIEMDLPPPMAVPGCQSLEKDIQFAREKSMLQALYFNKRMIPDSPAEPDFENHQMTDPVLIPLEDPVNNQEQDLRNVPWPEPKGSPPPEPQPVNMPPLFQAPPNQFPTFPNIGPPANFQGLPPQFPGGPGNPPNFIPPNMVQNDGWVNPQMMPPDMINQPNMFGHGPGGPNGPPPPDNNFNPMMENNFNPMQFNQPNNNMFPPNNFNMPRGGRGGFRGRGGPWVRMNGPTPGGWHRGGGVPHRGGRFCKNVKIHGYCRNRDNCPFVHPN